MAEFARLRETLEHEMDERFHNQDEIIDNLSMSMKTFQDTMKIVGETVCWFKFICSYNVNYFTSNMVIHFILSQEPVITLFEAI